MKKKTITAIGLMIALIAPIWAQTESDFQVTLTKDNTGASITGYTGSIMDVKIPAVIQGMPVKEIKASAFRNKGITSVTIPNNVITIESNGFSSCNNLTTITVDSGNTSYASENGILYNKAKTSLYFVPNGKSGSVTVPSTVTSIEQEAFRRSISITSVIIPNSVNRIGERAFYDCTGLTSVTMGNGVTVIGNYAFSGCTNLTSVTIGRGITDIGNYAFRNCTNLTSVTIPDSVTSIRFGTMHPFSGCNNLNLITIATLKRVGYIGFV